jgi:putative NADH-flavin reductase
MQPINHPQQESIKMKLEGKVALVTGSSQSIGQAIAFIDEVEQSKYIYHKMTVAY